MEQENPFKEDPQSDPRDQERSLISKKRKLSSSPQKQQDDSDEEGAVSSNGKDSLTPPFKKQQLMDEADQQDDYQSDDEPLPPVPQAPRHPTQEQQDHDDENSSLADHNLNQHEEGSVEEGEVGDEDEEGQLSEDDRPLLAQERLAHEPTGSSTAGSPTKSIGGFSSRREGGTANGSTTQRARRFEGCSPVTDYEFNKKIGEGTFGEVVIGKHKQTGQTVALKKVLIHNEKEGVPITALREIKILKAIEHPNVIHLNEIAYKRGEKAGHKRERGIIFMVFPYMDHDLSGLLENPAVWLSPAVIKSYIQQLLRGVNYLHKSHILHRDMKGANILIDNTGNLKIADFGLARTFADEDVDRDDAAYTNMVVTRWYRPPELFMGSTSYGPEVDMWGVGCVFGEMLKRRPIITGSDDRDQLERIFQLCGTPSEQSWPGYRNHTIFKRPEAEGGIVKFSVLHRRSIEEKFPSNHYDRYTVRFLDDLLTLNPRKRPTATEALRHRYFEVYPPPAEPGTEDFKVFPTSHELDTRNFRAERIKATEIATSAGKPAPAGNGLPHHHDAGISSRDRSDRYGGRYSSSSARDNRDNRDRNRGSSYRPLDDRDRDGRKYDSYRR